MKEKIRERMLAFKTELPFNSSSFKERHIQRTSAWIWSRFLGAEQADAAYAKKGRQNMTAKWNYCFF